MEIRMTSVCSLKGLFSKLSCMKRMHIVCLLQVNFYLMCRLRNADCGFLKRSPVKLIKWTKHVIFLWYSTDLSVCISKTNGN